MGQNGPDGPEVAGLLRKTLADKDPQTRAVALEVAFRRGLPEADDALLVKFYRAGPADVAESALHVIAERKTPPREVLLLVVDGLRHAEQSVREQAVETLGSLGDAVRPVLPELRRLAGRGSERWRIAALGALMTCGPAREDGEIFLAACRELDGSIRAAGLQALTSLDARDERIRPAALAAIRDDASTGQAREAAVWTLGYARPIRKEDVALLTAIAKDSKDSEASTAAHALTKMIGEYPAATEIVADLLEPGIDWSVSDQCRWALMRCAPRHPKLLQHMKALIVVKKVSFSEMDYIVGLGPDGALFAADLLNCLAAMTDKDDVTCQWIVEKLPRVQGVNPARAVPILLKSLRDGENLRGYTARAIGAFGPAAAPAVPALVKELSRKDIGVGFALSHAVSALGQIGPAAREALPALRGFIADPRRYRHEYNSIWHEAVVAAAKIDPSSAPGMVALLRAEIGVEDASCQGAALHWLGWIGPAAAPALADIRPFLADPRGPYFRPAAGAAARLGLLREVMDKLMVELKSGDKDRVIDACFLAGDIGSPAQAALPVLRALLNAPDKSVGAHAAGAIQEISGENAFSPSGGRAR